jgi:hypothetical protein
MNKITNKTNTEGKMIVHKKTGRMVNDDWKEVQLKNLTSMNKRRVKRGMNPYTREDINKDDSFFGNELVQNYFDYCEAHERDIKEYAKCIKNHQEGNK